MALADRLHGEGLFVRDMKTGKQQTTGFGEELRALRKRARLTQAQLATRAGITKQAVSALERGKALPRFDTFAAIVAVIAEQLKVSPRSIIEDRSLSSEPFRQVRAKRLRTFEDEAKAVRQFRESMKEIAHLIREGRRGKGLSLRGLAKESEVSSAWISQVEREMYSGSSLFSGSSYSRLKQVAEVLDIEEEIEKALRD